jgi:hypothetical protein
VVTSRYAETRYAPYRDERYAHGRDPEVRAIPSMTICGRMSIYGARYVTTLAEIERLAHEQGITPCPRCVAGREAAR